MFVVEVVGNVDARGNEDCWASDGGHAFIGGRPVSFTAWRLKEGLSLPKETACLGILNGTQI